MLVDCIKRLFKGKERDDLAPIFTIEELSKIELSSFGSLTEGSLDLEEKYSHKESKKNVLIVDDEETMFYIYKNCIKKMNVFCKNNKNVFKNYNVYYSFNKNAGIIALDSIFKGMKIDIAFLDLTLGFTLKLDKYPDVSRELMNKIIIVDGVDLAIEINKRNPDARIVFVTSHTNDFTIHSTKAYEEKFYNHFNRHIRDYYINKNSDKKCEDMCKILYGEK